MVILRPPAPIHKYFTLGLEASNRLLVSASVNRIALLDGACACLDFADLFP